MAAYLDSHHFQETRNRSAAVYKHSQFARQTKQNFVGLGFWKFGFPENSAYFGHNGGRYNKPSRFPKTNNFRRQEVSKFYFFSAHESASAVTSKSINNEDNVDEIDEADDGAEETSGSEESEEVLVANGENIEQLK